MLKKNKMEDIIMKTKDINKKLKLKKATVTSLNHAELNRVNGGSDLACELTYAFTVCRTACVTDCLACPTERGITC
jgi:hypothetical protein